MKLLCDACSRLLPPASWAVSDGALHLTCAGCGATAVLRAEVDVASTPGVPPPVIVADTVRAPPPVAAAYTSGEPSWLDAEWAALEARWDDPDAHRRILDRAEAAGDVASLGRRYKERLDRAPGDAIAVRARDELLKRATVRLMVARPPAPKGGVTAKNVVAATVLLTGLGLLVILLLQLVLPAGAP